MATVIEERQLRVYCPTHKIGPFEVPESGRILCESGGHALAMDFPRDDFWEYCCDCRVFWPSEMGRGGKAKESCPVCARAIARRYLCYECKLVSVESDEPARGKQFRIRPRGEIEPDCPGCRKAAKPDLREHACEDAAASFRTSRDKCPFCEEPIRKPESDRPAEKIFCGRCGAKAEPHYSFCKECGGPVGKNAARQTVPLAPDMLLHDAPPSAYTPPGPASSYTPPAEPIQDGTSNVTAPLPDNVSPGSQQYGSAPSNGSVGALVAVGLVALVLVILVVGAVVSSKNTNNGGGGNYGYVGDQFKDRFDRALAANQFFTPSGDCVADLYNAEAARSPNSSALAEAASKIRTRLDPIGDDAIKRYYAESDDTVDWDYTGKVYGLLKKVTPDNQEYAARYAYSMGLVNLKNKSFSTAVSNFQEALRYHPNWVMAYNGLGRVYVQDDWSGRDYNKTVEYYSKACDLDASFTWGCRNLGAYYAKVNDWPNAETYMSKALQRSPGRDSIWKAMAKICPKVSKYQDPSTGFCAGGR